MKYAFSTFLVLITMAQGSRAEERTQPAVPVTKEAHYFELKARTKISSQLAAMATFSQFLNDNKDSLPKREFQLLERFIEKNKLTNIPVDQQNHFFIESVSRKKYRIFGASYDYNPRQKLRKRVDAMVKLAGQLNLDPTLELPTGVLWTMMASISLNNEAAQFAKDVQACHEKILGATTGETSFQLVSKTTETQIYRPGETLDLEYKSEEKGKNITNLIPFASSGGKFFTIILNEAGQIVHSNPVTAKVEEVAPNVPPIKHVVDQIPADLISGNYKAVLCMETPGGFLGGQAKIEGASQNFILTTSEPKTLHTQDQKVSDVSKN